MDFLHTVTRCGLERIDYREKSYSPERSISPKKRVPPRVNYDLADPNDVDVKHERFQRELDDYKTQLQLTWKQEDTETTTFATWTVYPFLPFKKPPADRSNTLSQAYLKVTGDVFDSTDVLARCLQTPGVTTPDSPSKTKLAAPIQENYEKAILNILAPLVSYTEAFITRYNSRMAELREAHKRIVHEFHRLTDTHWEVADDFLCEEGQWCREQAVLATLGQYEFLIAATEVLGNCVDVAIRQLGAKGMYGLGFDETCEFIRGAVADAKDEMKRVVRACGLRQVSGGLVVQDVAVS